MNTEFVWNKNSNLPETDTVSGARFNRQGHG